MWLYGEVYPEPVATTEVVLFDMGGVLVELGSLDAFLGAQLSREEFWATWLASPTVRRFERGDCDDLEFGRGLVDEFALDCSPAEVVERFGRFPKGLYPGAAQLVADVASTAVATGVLSNTNRLHWDHQQDHKVLHHMFDHLFLSFEMGLVKPDRELFECIVADLACDPSAIFFVDDNQINVDGARAAGLRAARAEGPTAARAALVEHGVLTKTC